MLRVVVAGLSLWALTAFAEAPAGEQVLHTKDGRSLRGFVVSETQQGYLFKMVDKTELILFSNIQDLLPAEGPVPSPPPPPPPVAPPPPPPVSPASEPHYEGTPPPPAGEPVEEPPNQAAQPLVDWRSERKGFHWSIGAGGMVNPGSAASTVAGYVAAAAAARWGLGWLDIAAEVMPLGYFKGSVKALFVGLNPQLRINFARFYSLGVGVYSAVVLSPGVDFCIGPSFSPAIFRFGSMGEHEARLWAASPLLATSSNFGANSGVMLLLASYSYVF